MTINCEKINIKNGSTGIEVKELQKYLKYYNYYNGVLDGKCGTLTTTAIKSYQRDKKLVVDGIFGTISCKNSNINGADISLTQNTIPLTQWQDMINRYNNYLTEHNKEPLIMYIDKQNPYEFITLAKYKEIKNRYDQYIKEHNTYPTFMYINKTTITTTNNNNQTDNIKITTTTTNNTTDSYYKNGTYHSGKHWTSHGCNKMGQCTSYFCADCAMRQQNAKWNIDSYSQYTLAGYAGTTSAGTSHNGIETAIANVAKLEGINLKVEWKNFSDLGNSLKERFEALGKIISQQNKGVILHTLYQNKWGHYESIQEINMNKQTVTVLNSLGNKCGSPAFCGYIETRSWNTMRQYLAGISQKSVCIITKT